MDYEAIVEFGLLQ